MASFPPWKRQKRQQNATGAKLRNGAGVRVTLQSICDLIHALGYHEPDWHRGRKGPPSFTAQADS